MEEQKIIEIENLRKFIEELYEKQEKRKEISL